MDILKKKDDMLYAQAKSPLRHTIEKGICIISGIAVGIVINTIKNIVK